MQKMSFGVKEEGREIKNSVMDSLFQVEISNMQLTI